jgi:hypothetical protein
MAIGSQALPEDQVEKLLGEGAEAVSVIRDGQVADRVTEVLQAQQVAQSGLFAKLQLDNLDSGK